MTDKTPWTVTQEDREAAATTMPSEIDAALRIEVLCGLWDARPLVQAFARHRHESQAELVEALREAHQYLKVACGVISASGTLWMGQDSANAKVAELSALLAKIGGAA